MMSTIKVTILIIIIMVITKIDNQMSDRKRTVNKPFFPFWSSDNFEK